MKKLLTVIIVVSLMLTVLSGCSKARSEALDEIAKSCSDSTYYDREQKEVDALVDEYTKKINDAKDDREINKLKDEAIGKISEVYSKKR